MRVKYKEKNPNKKKIQLWVSMTHTHIIYYAGESSILIYRLEIELWRQIDSEVGDGLLSYFNKQLGS